MTRALKTAEASPGMLEAFKQRAGKFAQTFDYLSGKRSTVARHPTLRKDYTALMERGRFVRAAIEKVTGGVDAVTGWFKNVLGEVDTQHLGFLPLIPVAVITAGTASIAKWMSDAFTFSRRLEAIERYEGKGMSPEAAADLVNAQQPAGLFNFKFGNMAMPIYALAIAGFAYLMWRNRKQG